MVCRSFCISRRSHWTALPRHLLPSLVSCFFTTFFCRALACDVTRTHCTLTPRPLLLLWPTTWHVAAANQSCYVSNCDPYWHTITQHGHTHPRPPSHTSQHNNVNPFHFPCHTADRTALATPQLVQTPPSTMHTGTPCNRATADTDGSSGAVAQPSNPGRHGTTAASRMAPHDHGHNKPTHSSTGDPVQSACIEVSKLAELTPSPVPPYNATKAAAQRSSLCDQHHHTAVCPR